MHSYIRPNTHVSLRLPSGVFKIIEIKPNTTINIGKFGSFPANLLLGRPYCVTYELLDKEDGKSTTELRIVPAAELHAEALGNEYVTPTDVSREETAEGGTTEFDIVGEDGAVIMRSNRMTVDDPSRQKLSMEEIEELKKAGTGSGKEIIAKIMASHMAIDEKTNFSLAKYTLRKAKKYLKRFTAFPLDVGMLAEYVIEKEGYKIMDLREECLGLLSSWANIHCGDASRVMYAEDGVSQVGGGRWLVVDDTGGLVVASLAEKMGILYPNEENDESDEEDLPSQQQEQDVAMVDAPARAAHGTTNTQPPVQETGDTAAIPEAPTDTSSARNPRDTSITTADTTSQPSTEPTPRPRRAPRQHIPPMSSQTNTLTVVHCNNQPNLAHLKYFSFDAGNPSDSHPLYAHLKSISWLQLMHPEDDPTYVEPEILSEETLASLKSSKRGNYYKKRRRWERTSRVVDETRRGGFDGLVVASYMDTKTVLRELVPLVRGGGRVVVYNPNVEPLVELCDYYSKDRRAAYVERQAAARQNGGVKKEKSANGDEEEDVEDEDFPVNPTLLLAPMLQTARARHWQVLPERTHPMMTSRGGPEGYLFTATRVLPAEGRVEARGHFRGKKRKTGAETAVAVQA